MSQSQLYIAVYSQLDASVASYKRLSTREGISLVDPSTAPTAISLKYEMTEKGGLDFCSCFCLQSWTLSCASRFHLQLIVPCCTEVKQEGRIGLSGEAPP